MPDDAPKTRPSTVAPPLTATSTKTTPIADAVRGEIKQILDAEMLDLKMLADLVEVARTGRDLVAVRNPTARFDAKAQGLGNQSGMQGGMPGGAIVTGGFICGDEDMDDDCSYPQWKGQGPGVRGAKQRMEDDVRKVLQDSPLAKAAKTEILALTDSEPFAAGELLQIEQLASHTLRLLLARLGLSSPQSSGRISRRNFSYGGSMNPYPAQSPFSSPETFGAHTIRELVASKAPKDDDPLKLVLAISEARRLGEHEVAAKLEMELTGSPPAAAPAPEPEPERATSAEPKGGE